VIRAAFASGKKQKPHRIDLHLAGNDVMYIGEPLLTRTSSRVRCRGWRARLPGRKQGGRTDPAMGIDTVVQALQGREMATANGRVGICISSTMF
jgi:hypothetical protein